jgi:glycosyltransferase involved in cell wall biosynthesis
MKNKEQKPKIALMSYAMDNRMAKGTALYARKLIEGLLKDDRFDFYLVHYDKIDDPLYKRTHEIIMPRVKLPYGSRFVSQLLFFWKYRNNGFDIIHWFQPRVYPFYWLAPAKKIIITAHGAGDISAPNHFVFSRSMFNFVLIYFHKWVDKVIVDCEDAKSEVVKYYGLPINIVESIYLGGAEDYRLIEKTNNNKLLKKYGILDPYILDVSRLQPHKNIVTLINAYIEMRKLDTSRTEKLVIIGCAAYKDRNDEYDAARKSPFAKDIIFINYIDIKDLNTIYSYSELFVFPSLSEGFGLPILEAMASGTPVVTSNTTSLPEIGGNAVITVNPLNTKEIADAMRLILTDEILKKKLIKLGVCRAREFTWEKTVNKTKDLYNRLL